MIEADQVFIVNIVDGAGIYPIVGHVV